MVEAAVQRIVGIGPETGVSARSSLLKPGCSVRIPPNTEPSLTSSAGSAGLIHRLLEVA